LGGSAAIRQQSVDLLLICLGGLHPVTDSTGGLGQQHDVPPVLVDQRLNQAEVRKNFAEAEADAVDSRNRFERYCHPILPSISMEELVDHIHQTLTVSTQSAQIAKW